MTTTLITDGFDSRIPCNCGRDGMPLESHTEQCAVMLDAKAEAAYFDWYLGDYE
jgi:hypothetical protein